LIVLRVPSALMAGATTLATGMIAFELGARKRARVIAASCAASDVLRCFYLHRVTPPCHIASVSMVIPMTR
jgi:hypothetical protein